MKKYISSLEHKAFWKRKRGMKPNMKYFNVGIKLADIGTLAKTIDIKKEKTQRPTTSFKTN